MALDAVAQLDDKVSGPANAMGSALAQLQAKMLYMTTVSEMLNQKHIADATSANLAAQAELTLANATLAAAKASAVNAKAAKDTKSSAAEAGKATSDLTDKLGSMVDSGTNAGGVIGKLQTMLAGLGPEGQAAAAAIGLATIAITAFVGAMLAGAAAAIQIVQQRAALLATFGALSGGVAGGKATLDIVDKLAAKLPFTTEQVAKWATSLQSAGLQGKSLENAIKAVAAATAIMGESGGAAAEKMIKQLEEGGKGADTLIKSLQQGGAKSNRILADMGLQTKDVAAAAGMTEAQFKKANLSAAEMQKAIEKALQKKGAGPLDELGMTFPVLIAKLKEGLMSLLDGLGPSVKPFMTAVKELFGEFSKGGGAIKVLKPIIQEVFSTLFAWATRAVTFIHEAFQSIVIAGLKIRIALNPAIEAFKKFATNAEFLKGVKVVLGAIAIVVLVVVGTFLLFVAAGIAVVAAIGIIIYGAVRLIGIIGGGVVAAFTKVKAAIKGFSLPSLASAAGTFVMSFVTGITSKIGNVVSAMMGMGKAAGAALKSALGIASPSKVALAAAGNVTETFSDKIEDGKSDTQAAFDGLVKVPPPGKGGSGKNGGKDGKGALAAALNRIANALESSPGFRELLMAALEEEERSGSDMDPA